MQNKEIKVLMVGSNLSVKGGITSVVKQFLNYEWSEEIELKYIPTYIETNKIFMIMYYIKSLINMTIYTIFNKVDIIHIHMSHTGSFYRKYIVFKIFKLLNKKVIIHLHGSEFERFFESTGKITKRMIKNMLDNSDKVLVLGERWNGIIKKISCTCNTEILLNTVSIPTENIEYHENKKNILFLGALVKRKGIFELIESINNLKLKKILDEYNVNFIIGGSGREEEKIKELIKTYKLGDNIKLVGWVDGERKKDLIKCSNIFVLPSHNEGLPVAILEALSYGLPVVTTNVGSIDEAVIDNYNGFLINPFDVKQLEESLYKIIRSKEIWETFSKNAKKIAKEKFDECKYFDHIKVIYRTI